MTPNSPLCDAFLLAYSNPPSLALFPKRSPQMLLLKIEVGFAFANDSIDWTPLSFVWTSFPFPLSFGLGVRFRLGEEEGVVEEGAWRGARRLRGLPFEGEVEDMEGSEG